jgi:hypothetical protein
MVTWENYEEWIMLYADGELGIEETDALLAFVGMHPELKTEMALYAQAKLTFDPTEVYTHKEQLIQPVLQNRVIAVAQWKRYGIAAGIAIIILTSLIKYLPASSIHPGIAEKDTINNTIAKGIKTNALTETITRIPDNAAPITLNTTATKLAARPKIKGIPMAISTNCSVKARSNITNLKEEALQILPYATLPVTTMNAEAALSNELTEIPAYTIASVEEKKSTFWSKLPIDDIKKKQLENIAGALGHAYTNVQDVKQEIEATTINIRVEKKKIVISF